MMSDARGQRSVRLNVQDWPNIGRSSTLSLDPSLARSEADLLDYCRERFGDGKLRESGEQAYEYCRSLSLPGEVKKLITFLLNKSC